MIPIAKHFDPVLGIDIHILTIPPVGPVPIPHPHIGIVFDPIDYVPILGSTIKVNGVPRATAGTSGKAIPHIPLGGPFAMPPGNEDEIFMGSTTVRADEAPLSFGALPVLSCQSVGMMAPIRKKPKKTFGMTLPTTIVMPIPAGMPVLVGGPPTIDVVGAGMALGLAGLGKAFKKFKSSKLGKKLGAKFKKAKQKACKNMKPGFLKCKVLRAEPVNSITGEVVVEQSDFNIDGRIAIKWNRYYSSQSEYRGVCGNGWETPADIRLVIDAEGQALFYEGGPGARVFPHLPDDMARVGPVLNENDPSDSNDKSVTELVDGAVLTLSKGFFTIRTKEGKYYQFQRSKGNFDKRKPQPVTLYIEKIFDDCNNSLSFVRDEHGQLQRIEESAGRAIVVTSKGGLVRRLDFYHPEEKQLLQLTRYEYDIQGNLVTVFDALDAPYRFEYQNDVLIRHTDRNGLSFYYKYDQQTRAGKCVHAYGDNGLYDYHFEYQSQITVFINSLGHKSSIEFDENNLPLKETDEVGLVKAFEYDEAGRTTAVIDGRGNRTEFVYDRFGNTLQQILPDGNSVTTEYDHNGNPITIKDPNGNVWRQEWTDFNVMTRQFTPSGAVTEYRYDRYGRITQITNALGGCSTLQYDAYGNLKEFKDAIGNVTRFKSDVFGNTTDVTTPTGRNTRYVYDEKSRVIRFINPSGTIVDCVYDGEDNLTSYRDEAGNITKLEYRGLGELARRIQADGTIVRYERDTEEQITGVINERGQIYKLLRDARGRIIEAIDYWGNSTNYKYDEADNPIKTVDPLGRETIFKYDDCGRLRKRILPDGNAENFEYDANGNLIKHENQYASCERKYDEENRLIEEAQGTFKVVNSYDEMGNRTRRSSSIGNDICYLYDMANRIQGVKINDKVSLSITKDADGFTIKETLGRNLERRYEYNSDRYITRQTVSTEISTVADRKYAYDPVGNLIEKADFRSGRSFFSYDPMGRVVKAVDPKSRVDKFFYDPAGDLARSDHLEYPESGLRKAHYRDYDYFYDAAGNLTRRHGKNADLELRWDGKNQLIESVNGNGQTTSYHYDAQGRRCSKKIDDDETCFQWDGNHLLSDHSGDSDSNEFVYYPDTFEPLALINNSGEIYTYLNDANGAPLELCTTLGEIVWSVEYDSLGRADANSKNKIDNPLRLQGQYYDIETGLHYNRFRYYDTHVGAFISQDPLGLMAGDNLYQFAPNTLSWIDPFGLSCEDEVPKWKGAADYSSVIDPKNLANTKPTPRQVREMKRINMEHNDGLLRSDLDGTVLVESKKSKKGVTPPANEAQIDHILPVDKGGTRTSSNLQIISRKQNRDKWNT